jgi:tight adherence protein B
MQMLPALLITALGLLAGLLLTGLSVARTQRVEHRRRRRFEDVLGFHNRHQQRENTAIRLTRAETESASLEARLCSLFGLSLNRRHAYPMPWPILLSITLAIACGLGLMISFMAGAVGWVMALPLWPLVSRTLLKRFEQRRAAALFKQFPDALAMIVRGVRVGVPVTDSVRAIAKEAPRPTADEFASLAVELAIGVPLEDALRSLAQRNGLQEYRFFATALALQSQTGGRLGETLENLAEVIRRRVAVRARGYALAGEARMTSAILAGLPFVAFGGLLILSPQYGYMLVTQSSGHKILAVAIGELIIGWFVIQTMINRALS